MSGNGGADPESSASPHSKRKLTHILPNLDTQPNPLEKRAKFERQPNRESELFARFVFYVQLMYFFVFISIICISSRDPQPGPSGIQRSVIETTNGNSKQYNTEYSSGEEDEAPTNVYVSNASRPQTVIQSTFTHQPTRPLLVDWLLDNDSDDSSSSSVEYVPPAELPVSLYMDIYMYVNIYMFII